MYTFQISEVLDQAWALTKKYGLILALFVFVIQLVPSLFSGGDQQAILEAVTDMQSQMESGAEPAEALATYVQALSTAYNPGLLTLGSIIEVLLGCAFTAILLSLAKGERSDVSIEPAKLPIMTYVKYFGVKFLTGIFVGLGCLLCILPGIWLAVKLSLAGYYVIERPEIGIWDAIKASWRDTNHNFWNLLGLYIVAGIIGGLGLLACCIGVYFTLVIYYFAGVVVYLVLSGWYTRNGDSEAIVVE